MRKDNEMRKKNNDEEFFHKKLSALNSPSRHLVKGSFIFPWHKRLTI